jgi:enoyl-[acyl-carrier-protein] reductase (NADH)
LSDLARGISGEMVHVDGGFHAMGAPVPALSEPANTPESSGE